MESNHRLLGVGQESLPLDHGTLCVVLASGSRGTRTHKRCCAATCFQDRLLIQPDDFRWELLAASWSVGAEGSRSINEKGPVSL